MTVISLGNNISSLKAQRQLNNTSASLASTYERLSSGQRINRASDDAAGLAISSKLNAHARVYGQALRNANDGISALNIAEGAVTQLSDILIRIKELAESSSNGVLGLSQRRSLDAEAKALTDEYNRILSTTKFNKNKLVDGTLSELGIQLGFGASGRLSFGLGDGLERTIGTGQFTSKNPGISGTLTAADFNGDGRADTLASYSGIGLLFEPTSSTGTIDTDHSVQLFASGGIISAGAGDVNGDGKMDVAYYELGSSTLRIRLGNGDGTFGTESQHTAAATIGVAFGYGHDITFGDFNGDGALDIAAGSLSNSTVFLNNGAGGFGAGVCFASDGAPLSGVQAGDMNGDGNLDLVYSNGYLAGNGDGSFGSLQNFGFGTGEGHFALADFNHDGLLDVLAYSNSDSSLHLISSNSDGTFYESANFGNQGATGLIAADFNADGNVDIFTHDGTSIRTYFGNGDGSFQIGISSTAFSSSGMGAMAADYNGDGVLDALSGGHVHHSGTTSTNTTQRFNLTTREAALETLDLLDDYINRVSKELGNIGSAQSRLQSAVNTISQTRENYMAAYSRIMDADVANETAKLVIDQIRQQAATSIMAQANQQPALAIRLLGQ